MLKKTTSKYRMKWIVFGVVQSLGMSFVSANNSVYPLFSTESEQCILPASEHHGVNPFVLRAILKVESGLKPGAVGKNKNGTVDIGIGQINSMHIPELQRLGVAPDWLTDACVGTFVAGWHLSKQISRYGNTWFGVATYHSATPYFNYRYQILLHNEMIRSGVLTGQIYPVPPLR